MAKASQQTMRIVVKSFDHTIINEAVKSIIEAIESTGAVFAGPIPLPTKKKKFSVLRSTNNNKKAFEQFEIRTHKRVIDIHESSAQTIPTLQALQLPNGVEVEMKV